MKQNGVIFKGSRKGINIILDETLEFSELKNLLSEKLLDADKFFSGAKTAITFSGKELTDAEEKELLDVITERSQMNISFVGDSPQTEKKTPNFSYSENSTYFHKGSLRSGQEIRYWGSVVIIGDVNPGGSIVAEGNIVVLGTLMGTVHAGCGGMRDCYVAAINLQATQIRIADVITYIPNSHKRSSQKELLPAYVYINDGKIYVEPLTN